MIDSVVLGHHIFRGS